MIHSMIGSDNSVYLASQEPEKSLDIEAMPHRPEGGEIFFSEPK